MDGKRKNDEQIARISFKRSPVFNLIGAITLRYSNIGNLLPSRDTTILVKNMTTNY